MPMKTLEQIKAVRGKHLDYLAMTLDYNAPGVLRVDMTDYVKRMIDNFPETLQGTMRCSWNETLFKFDEKSIGLMRTIFFSIPLYC